MPRDLATCARYRYPHSADLSFLSLSLSLSFSLLFVFLLPLAVERHLRQIREERAAASSVGSSPPDDLEVNDFTGYTGIMLMRCFGGSFSASQIGDGGGGRGVGEGTDREDRVQLALVRALSPDETCLSPRINASDGDYVALSLSLSGPALIASPVLVLVPRQSA